jgi:5'-deoxynucleotidase YfbR-like HD superfamily hydrolase
VFVVFLRRSLKKRKVLSANKILPAVLDEAPHYNRQEVIDMLIWHDLGEIQTGDVSPANLTEGLRASQKLFVDQFAMQSYFIGFDYGVKIAKLCEDFEANRTLNARIAQDIDKLDSLLQASKYLEFDESVQELKEFIASVFDEIETSVIRNILQLCGVDVARLTS